MSDNFSVKSFGFRRNLDFVKTSFILYIKRIKEYKSNLYLSFLANTTFMFMFVFFLYSVKSNFEDIFYWGLKEFFFFLIFVEIIVFIFHPLFQDNLSLFLLKGDFNTFLIRPVNSFVQYAMNSSHFFALFVNITYITLLIYFLIFIYPEFSFIKLIITFLFGFLGGIFYTSIVVMIRCMSFFLKESKFVFKMFKKAEDTFFIYPSVFFQKSFIGGLILLMPVTYYGSYATEYFLDLIGFSKILHLSLYLVIMIFICFVIAYFLWHYGLKRYEAFG